MGMASCRRRVRGHPPLVDDAPAVVLASPVQAAAALASVPVPTPPRPALHAAPRVPGWEADTGHGLGCALPTRPRGRSAWRRRCGAGRCGRFLPPAWRKCGARGVLQHLLDDGSLVLFGAPVAQEDSARRAVRAALRLQRRLRSCRGRSVALGRGVCRLPGTTSWAVLLAVWRRWGLARRGGGHDAARRWLTRRAAPEPFCSVPQTGWCMARCAWRRPIGPPPPGRPI